MDRIEEETSKEIRRQKESMPPGSETFNMDSDDVRILPAIIDEELGGIGSLVESFESWIHSILTVFY
jgi:hypothetical protein